MRIKAGKYIINSDAYSMWIDEEYESKTGKTATKRIAGYSNDVSHLLNDFRSKKINGSDARTMDELLMTMKNALDEAEELLKAMIDNQFELEVGGGAKWRS